MTMTPEQILKEICRKHTLGWFSFQGRVYQDFRYKISPEKLAAFLAKHLPPNDSSPL